MSPANDGTVKLQSEQPPIRRPTWQGFLGARKILILIDMVMIVNRYNFKEAVQYLKGLDPQKQAERRDALAEMLPNLLKRTP